MRKLPLVLLAILFFAISLPIHAQRSTDEPVPRFENTTCTYTLPRGVDATCGYLIVLADRSQPEGDLMELAVTILKSSSDHPESDPIVSLTGGPGGITVPYLSFQFRKNYFQFLEHRDFIMFDQRGVGFSRPTLDCTGLVQAEYRDAEAFRTADERLDAFIGRIINCKERLLRNGNDLSLYSSAINAEDLNDLRLALGYDDWNLFGVSYGTKIALTAMRDTPEGIRSVILDSVFPLEVNLYEDLAAHQWRSFDLLFTTCTADPACNETFPDLEETFYQTVERYNAEPQLIRGQHNQARFFFESYVDGDQMAGYIFNRLYVKDEIRTLPALIQLFSEDDEESLIQMAQSYLDSSAAISEGMHYSIRCGEEISFTDRQRALDNGQILPPALQAAHQRSIDRIFNICADWQVPAAAEIENQAVNSDIPALILSGEFDPITPPEWGQLAANDLSNAFFYVLPTVGHGVVRSDLCGLSLAKQFLDNPYSAPDGACIDEIEPIVFDIPQD